MVTNADGEVAKKPKYSILVDVSTCIACMKCVEACESYHKEQYDMNAQGAVYTKVTVIDGPIAIPQLCLHCVDSPCAKACITHAITQLDYGPVIYDRDKCIGCLLCVNQCPFHSITYDPLKRTIYKCDMCYKRIEKGMKPNCVEICPTGTRSFGPYEDKLDEGMKLAEEKNGVLLYSGEVSTLYALTDHEFESLIDREDVTVVKNAYPPGSRWIAEILEYSRIAWVPVILGTLYYASKWLRSEPKDKHEA